MTGLWFSVEGRQGIGMVGRRVFLFLILSLNFLANSDDLVSLEFFFLCSAFFDLCPFLSVLVSTEMWVTDLSPSYCKSLTHMLPPQGVGFTGEKWEK